MQQEILYVDFSIINNVCTARLSQPEFNVQNPLHTVKAT